MEENERNSGSAKRCPKCGAAMSSRFCPECGYDSNIERLTAVHKCPNCGELITSRFCPECGYDGATRESVRIEKKRVSVKSEKKAIGTSKLYIILGYMPIALVALFSLLLFAFYAAPVAVMPAQEMMGEKIASESYGNVYSMYSGILSEFSELKGAMIALIVCAVVAVLFAAAVGVMRLIDGTKLKRVEIGNASLTLTEFVAYIGGVVIFLLFLIFGCVICGKISAFDEGMEIVAAGVCPMLMIVFSIIFLVLDGGVCAFRQLCVVRSPEFAKAESKHIEGKKYNADGTEYVSAFAKFKKALYKARIPVIVVTAVVTVGVSVSVPLGLHFTNIFRVGKVENVEIGMDRAQVVKILGEPDGESVGGDRLYWYESIVAKKIEQLEELINGDGTYDAEKIEKKTEDLESSSFDYIMVKFDGDGKVFEVFLDKNHKYSRFDDYSTAVEKTAKKTTLSGSILDGANVDGRVEVVSEYNGMTYFVEFSDDSYYKSIVGNGKIDAIGGSSQKGYTAKLTWGDSLGKFYSKDMSVNVLYTINDGALTEVNKDLKTFTVPDGVMDISENALDGCDKLKFNIYENSEYLGNSVNPYMILVKITDYKITSKTINRNTQIIYKHAFDGVTSIGDEAFCNCSSLTSITIPNGVTSIGRGAFSGCSSLLSITIPNSVTSIGKYAFYYCSGLSDITIPNSVTSIGSGAFFGCSSLTSITIPNSVTSIENGAFYDCSSLTSITFKGTKAQWSDIAKDSNWNYNTSNYTVHCTDGDIVKS